MLQFYDELAAAPVPAKNPLPAGIFVTITQFSGRLLIGTAYTTAGGLCNVPVVAGETYTATFYGTRAPANSLTFTGSLGTTTIIVPNYRSPALSTAGYQLAQAELFPLLRASSAALLPGGGIYNLQMAHGAVLAELDQQVQSALGSDRLDSSTGSQIDTFANDFIGRGVWPRAPGESDAAYIARIKLWFGVPFGTINGMTTILNAYLTAFGLSAPINDPGILTGVLVFDTMSDPSRSINVGLNPLDAQFCIFYQYALPNWQQTFQLNYADLNQSTYFGALDFYSSSPLNSYLATLVNTVKIAGSQPVYYSNKSS